MTFFDDNELDNEVLGGEPENNASADESPDDSLNDSQPIRRAGVEAEHHVAADSAAELTAAARVATDAAPLGVVEITAGSAAPARAVAEDLRTPWDWVDLIIFALLAVGGAVLISVLLIGVFKGFGIGPAQLRASTTAKSYFAIVNQIVLSFALLGYLAVQTNVREGAGFWRTIGWRPLVTKHVPKAAVYLSLVGGGFLLSIVVQFASNFSRPKGKLPIETFFQDRGSALLLMLMSVLLAPVLEETIFRGFIYPVIARSLGIAASVIVTGIIFGMLHASQLWGGWTQIGLLVIVGIIFTWVRATTRTVLASYVMHLSYNSFLFLVFLISSHWLRAMPRGR